MKSPALSAVAMGLSFGLASAVSAHHGGECYVSSNNSHICVVRTGDQQFSAAVTDGRSVKPTVLALDCKRGWRGAGALTADTMALIVDAICSDHDHEKSPTTSVVGLI